MILLSAGDGHRVRSMFDSEHLSFVIEAIIAGNSPAIAWADDPLTPGTALIWDRAHCLYLGGDYHSGDPAGSGWQGLFLDEIEPAGSGIFKLYARAPVPRLAGRALHPRERVLYRARWHPDGTGLHGPAGRDRAGVQISSIVGSFAELARLANFGAVIEEIESCWTSMDDFREAGFGFCAHDDETIMSWCTAEYVSGGRRGTGIRCGMGIETVPAFRERGLATLTAGAFVRHCAARGVLPHWDSWSANMPSVAIAEKLGFQKVGTYLVSVGEFGG